MSMLTRYLTRLFLIRFAILLIGMTAFLLGLDLMVNANRVMADQVDSLGALIRYTLLRLPIVVSDLIKICALLAGLLSLFTLIKSSELTAIWSSGVSQFGLLRRLIPLAVVLGGIQLVIDDRIVPGSISELREWGIVDDLGQTGGDSPIHDVLWIHVGNDIVRVPAANVDSRNLRDFVLFERDELGDLQAQLNIGEARYDDGAWRLFDVTVRRAGAGAASWEAERSWPIGLDIASINHVMIHPRNLPISQIRRFTSGDGQGTWAPHLYETWLYEKLARGLVPLLMFFLSISLAQQSHRVGHIEFLLLGGIVVGFSFFIFSGVTLAMGEVGLLPPLLASTAPLLVFASIAGSVAFWHELKRQPAERSAEAASLTRPERSD